MQLGFAKTNGAGMPTTNIISTSARHMDAESNGRSVKQVHTGPVRMQSAQKCDEPPAGGPDGFEEYEDLTKEPV